MEDIDWYNFQFEVVKFAKDYLNELPIASGNLQYRASTDQILDEAKKILDWITSE